MSIPSPSLLWNIPQELGKAGKEQARSNAGLAGLTGSSQTNRFITHISENSTTGNLLVNYGTPLAGTFYATTSTTFAELKAAYDSGQTIVLVADKSAEDTDHVYMLNWISKSGSTISAFEFIALDKWAEWYGNGNDRKSLSLKVDAWKCYSSSGWEHADIDWLPLATVDYVEYHAGPLFQANAVQAATGDFLLISDSSDAGKAVRSGIVFDTAAEENLFLNKRGAWNTALPAIYNSDAEADVSWDSDLADPGFYSVRYSPNPATDPSSPERNEMFALVGNSGVVGSNFKSQLAMGNRLFYRHSTGTGNAQWSDWSSVLSVTSQNVGSAPDASNPYTDYRPVYVKDGEVTACPILACELSSDNGDGLTLSYDSTNNWMCIGTSSYSAINKYVATAGTDPDVVPEHFEFAKAASLVFGDGFGYGFRSNYWGLNLAMRGSGNSRSPLLLEAPSVTYAVTTLASSVFRKDSAGPNRMQIEFWNEHRIKDYAYCSLYRVARDTSESLSYVSTSWLSTSSALKNVSICVVPAHHWAIVNGTIKGTYNLETGPGNTDASEFSFYFWDTPTNSNNNFVDPGDELCLGYTRGYWTYPGESTPSKSMPYCNFNFFCYNSANQDKYVLCDVKTMGNADFVINKQLLIFKTPEMDSSFNLPYVAPPSNLLGGQPPE